MVLEFVCAFKQTQHWWSYETSVCFKAYIHSSDSTIRNIHSMDGPIRIMSGSKQIQQEWYCQQTRHGLGLSEFCLLESKHNMDDHIKILSASKANKPMVRVLFALKETQHGWFYQNSVCLKVNTAWEANTVWMVIWEFCAAVKQTQYGWSYERSLCF